MNELAKTEPDPLKTSNNLEIKYKLKISIFKKNIEIKERIKYEKRIWQIWKKAKFVNAVIEIKIATT